MVESVVPVAETVETTEAVVMMMPEADEGQICPVTSMATMMPMAVPVAVPG